MTGHSGKESHTKVKDGNLPMIEVICQRYAQIKIIVSPTIIGTKTYASGRGTLKGALISG